MPDDLQPTSEPGNIDATLPPTAAPPASPAPEPPAHPLPASIGNYRIVCLLGEGGMGAVYEAEQDQPRRSVALKVIKAAWASPEMLRRFEQESQALGRLQHPGIAQIYEAGSAEAGFGLQPFFAMELIHGKPLVGYADEHKLNTRQRLELMIQVCDAVHHAHQRGIIHRDLKPGNILVDETGQPKILDFGLARATDSDAQATRRTDMGQLLGTLAYMSPEQALADPYALDTRSDVYSLGVILYELLAGKMPYTLSRHLHEAVRTIQVTEPAPLSTVSRVYRGDIETIVAKALEKDKERRYASAAGLAGDIRRYLNDEPIVARPASASYQLQKFARRNKALVVGIAAVFAVLVLGIVASTWEAVQARSAEKKAKEESAIAQAVNDFLQKDLLAQASAYNQSKPDPNITVRTVLDRAAQNIQGKFDKQPEVEAAIRDTIGRTYYDMGLFPEARKQLERALELERRTVGAEDPRTLNTMISLGSIARRQARYAEAEALFNQILPVARRVLGPEQMDTVSAMNGLATVYFYQGKLAEAEALYVQILEIQRRTLGPENPQTLVAMNSLASAYQQEHKSAQAEQLFSQTLEIERRVLGPEHPDTLLTMYNLGTVYVAEGKMGPAEDLYKQSLEIRSRVLGPSHPYTLNSLYALADLYSRIGDQGKSEALYRQALKQLSRVLGPEHPDTLYVLSGLASAVENEGRYAEAERLYRQALEPMRRVLGPENENTLSADANLGEAYRDEGKFDLAARMAAEALGGRRHALGNQNVDTMEAAADLAQADLALGKFAEGELLAREAMETDKEIQPDAWERFRAECLLGANLAGEKKYAAAEPLLLEGYQGMMARKDKIMAVPDRLHLVRARAWIVQLYQAWGKPERALQWRQMLASK